MIYVLPRQRARSFLVVSDNVLVSGAEGLDVCRHRPRTWPRCDEHSGTGFVPGRQGGSGQGRSRCECWCCQGGSRCRRECHGLHARGSEDGMQARLGVGGARGRGAPASRQAAAAGSAASDAEDRGAVDRRRPGGARRLAREFPGARGRRRGAAPVERRLQRAPATEARHRHRAAEAGRGTARLAATQVLHVPRRPARAQPRLPALPPRALR